MNRYQRIALGIGAAAIDFCAVYPTWDWTCSAMGIVAPGGRALAQLPIERALLIVPPKPRKEHVRVLNYDPDEYLCSPHVDYRRMFHEGGTITIITLGAVSLLHTSVLTMFRRKEGSARA